MLRKSELSKTSIGLLQGGFWPFLYILAYSSELTELVQWTNAHARYVLFNEVCTYYICNVLVWLYDVRTPTTHVADVQGKYSYGNATLNFSLTKCFPNLICFHMCSKLTLWAEARYARIFPPSLNKNRKLFPQCILAQNGRISTPTHVCPHKVNIGTNLYLSAPKNGLSTICYDVHIC